MGYTNLSTYQNICISEGAHFEIFEDSLLFTDTFTNESFKVNGINNPIALAFACDCGGCEDVAVVTRQKEAFVLTGIYQSWNNNPEDCYINHSFVVHPVKTDEKIEGVGVYADFDIYTTCGSAVYYAHTENGELRRIEGYGNEEFYLGETREEIHPYEAFLPIEDPKTMFKDYNDLAMLYLYKDQTLHTGYAYLEGYKDREHWNEEVVRDESGKPLIQEASVVIYNEDNTVKDILILGKDKYLYSINPENLNFRHQPNITAIKLDYPKVVDMNYHTEYMKDSYDIKERTFTFYFENNTTLKYKNRVDGIGLYQYTTTNK